VTEHMVEVMRYGKGEDLQAAADRRRSSHIRWVNAQLENAQARRDQVHKREIRAFYAKKRKKKEGT